MSNNCDETKCSGDCSTCTGDGMTVTLTLDDDSTVECAIVGIFDAAEKEYIALLPLDENGQNEDGEVYLYRYAVGPNGAPQLDNIETDEEYEISKKIIIHRPVVGPDGCCFLHGCGKHGYGTHRRVCYDEQCGE